MIVRTDRGAYEFDQVLGADGAASVVRKRLARPFARAQLSVAAGFFVHGSTGSNIAVKTTPEQPGYLWSFPRTDHLAVGICAPANHHTTSGHLRAQSAAWIDNTVSIGTRAWSPMRGPFRASAIRVEARSVWAATVGCCSETRQGWSIRSRGKASTTRWRQVSGRPMRSRDVQITRRIPVFGQGAERHSTRARPGRAPEPAVFHPCVLITDRAGARPE